MNPVSRTFLLCAAIGSALSLADAQTIALREAPRPDATIVSRVEAGSEAILRASPVTDRAKAEAGWKQVAWGDATREGYLPSAKLSKNFEIELGTVLRAEPADESRVLTVVEPGDRFEVIESGDVWTTVRFDKPIVLYFQQSTVVAADPAINATAPDRAQPAPSPRRNFDPDASVGHVAPDALPPENVVWSTNTDAPAPAPVRRAPEQSIELAPAERSGQLQPIDIVVPSVQTQARETPIRPQADAGTPTRRLSGTLVREISNFGPSYPLRLKSENGRRLAYIDMTHLFIPNLQPYLGNQVVIQGEIRPVAPGSQDIVIFARSIRKVD